MRVLIGVIITFLAIACDSSQVTQVVGTAKLTPERIEAYIRAYKALKKQVPDLLQELNLNAVDPKNGFAKIESIIQEAGVDDYPAFVRLNAKIGAVFSIIQAEKGMGNFKNLEESSQQILQQGQQLIQEQLDNPEVPEETKEGLRQQLKELQAGEQQLTDTYAHNFEWANLVLEKVKDLTTILVDEEEVALVKEYESKLMDAYVGFPLPAGMNGKLPELQWDF